MILLSSLEIKSQNCFEADIMILVDFSGSERGNEDLLAGAAQLFVNELNVSEQHIRIGLITFSSYHENVSGLIGDRMDLSNEIRMMAAVGASGSTYLNDALLAAGTVLRNERMVPKIIIIVSDGEIGDMDESFVTSVILKGSFPLAIFAVQIGGDTVGLSNLVKITGKRDQVEIAEPLQLVEALKKLNLCN